MNINGITLECKVDSGVAIIACKGVFLLSDQIQLREIIQKYLEEGKNYFIFDFTDIRSVQSFIIGEILELSRVVKDKNGGVCLVNPSERLYYTLELMRVSKMAPIYSSVDEAMRILLPERD